MASATSTAPTSNLGDSSGSVVQSNFIGTDITGTVALSTATYYGVVLQNGSYTIGGLTTTPGTGLGNVISGNGVGIDDGNLGPASPVAIEGNIIGADPTGKIAVPNRQLRRRSRRRQPGHDRRHGGRRGEPDLGQLCIRRLYRRLDGDRQPGRGQLHRHRHHGEAGGRQLPGRRDRGWRLEQHDRGPHDDPGDRRRQRDLGQHG